MTVRRLGKPRTTDLRPWRWGTSLAGSSEHTSPRSRTGRSVVRGKVEGVDMKQTLVTIIAIFLITSSLGCSQPLTTREKGAIGGTAVGAGLGAIIGAATGNAGAGAGIGAAVGLLGGALIGDRMQKKEQEEKYQQDQLRQTQLELERQRREIERLKRQREY